MKLKDIEIGGRYLAKVSGKLTTVRVVEIREAPGFGRSRSATIIEAVNEATGRRYVEIAIMPSLQLQNGFVL